MNLLIVHNFYKSNVTGGEDVVVNAELRHLSAKNREINVSIFSMLNDKASFLSFAISPIFPLIQSIKLYRLIKRKNIELVHVHNYFPLITPFCFLVCKLARVEVVHTLHNFRPWCLAGTFYRDKFGVCNHCVSRNRLHGILNKCYKNSLILSAYMSFLFCTYRTLGLFGIPSKVFVVSKFQQKVVQELGLFKETIFNPNIIHVEHLSTPQSRRSDAFLFVGRIEESKGINVLLKIWSTLDKSLKLRVVGDGSDLKHLESVYAASNIEFLGNISRDRVFGEIAAAKFLIHPSLWYETMGLTLLEALQCGTPVIGFPIGTRSEFIQDDYNGYLCTPNQLPETLNKASHVSAEDYTRLQLGALNSFAKYQSEAIELFSARYRKNNA